MILTSVSSFSRSPHLLQDAFPHPGSLTGGLSETAQHLIAFLAMIPLRRFLP